MSDEINTFKVYELQPYNPYCNLTVILTLRNLSSFWQLECFVVNTGELYYESNKRIIMEPVVLNVTPPEISIDYIHPQRLIENFDEFLFNQGKEHIENRIINEYYKIFEDNETTRVQCFLIKLVEKEWFHLIGLHMRGLCDDQLKEAYSKSRNSSFLEYINKVMDVAPFDIKRHE
ncbi:MAG: hypothetical protein DHS20C13_17470 [Thermodesulfobacteriota bacterium]|nr:MAG: hypothetical protein DHS20C13_17470 [Thermodesulfobacteriota bacterium]